MSPNVFWKIVAFCICLHAPQAAWARLGETPPVLAQRYGRAVQTLQFNDFQRYRYEKNGFQVDIYFLNGRSVLESFISRGMSAEQANALVNQVAGAPTASCAPDTAEQVCKGSAIPLRNALVWHWTGGRPDTPVIAVFHADQCTVLFFSDPAIYARIQAALASKPVQM